MSMGTIAARKSLDIFENAKNVLAIEFLTAAQAIDFRDARKLGRTTSKAYKFIRRHVPAIIEDRELWRDIEKIKEIFPQLFAIAEEGSR